MPFHTGRFKLGSSCFTAFVSLFIVHQQFGLLSPLIEEAKPAAEIQYIAAYYNGNVLCA